MGPPAADVELLGPRLVDDRAVAVGDGPCPRGPPGTLDRGVSKRSDGLPVGVDDAHLKSFDALHDLDVHRSDPRAAGSYDVAAGQPTTPHGAGVEDRETACQAAPSTRHPFGSQFGWKVVGVARMAPMAGGPRGNLCTVNWGLCRSAIAPAAPDGPPEPGPKRMGLRLKTGPRDVEDRAL
jgi:hypothetical protein